MADIKKTLTKKDFCKPDCSCDGWNDNIYPSTTADQVTFNSMSLETWLSEGDQYNTIIDLIQHYVDGGSSYILPVASASTLGGVKIGSGLSITSAGVLSVTSTAAISPATTIVLGGIRLFSDIDPTLKTGSDWDEWEIGEDLEIDLEKDVSDESYALPVMTTSLTGDADKTRAFCPLPKKWITDLIEGEIPTYIAGDNITIASEDNKISSNDFIFDYKAISATKTAEDIEGEQTDGYEDSINYANTSSVFYVGNKTLHTNNGKCGLDSNGNLSGYYGFPRFALVSGQGITFRNEQDVYQTPPSEWSDTKNQSYNHVDELIIGIANASDNMRGGIKTGYTPQNSSELPVELGSDGRAYVDASSLITEDYKIINSQMFGYRAQHFKLNETDGIDASTGYCTLMELPESDNDYELIFEIISTLYYAKYKLSYKTPLNIGDDATIDFTCIGINSQTTLFTHSNIIFYNYGKYGTIYKKNTTNEVNDFYINVLSECNTVSTLFVGNLFYYTDYRRRTSRTEAITNNSGLAKVDITQLPSYSASNIRYPNTYFTQYLAVEGTNPFSLSVDVKANTVYDTKWDTYNDSETLTLNISSIEDSSYQSQIVLTIRNTGTGSDSRTVNITAPSNYFIVGSTTIIDCENLVITIVNKLIFINKGTWTT